jgi:hypothetical protein
MMTSTNHYLLLDGAQFDGLMQQVYLLHEAIDCTLLYQKTAYEALAEVGPLLVAVRPLSELAQVFQREWQATAGIWLESDADEAVLVEHLRSLIHAQVEGVTVLLRYYDPRIIRSWLGPMTDNERDVLLGPVSRIRLADDTPETCLQRLSQQVEPARYTDTPWVRLSQAQLEQMTQAKQEGFEQRLLAHVKDFYPACLHDLDAAAQRQWLANCRASAAYYGYSGSADVTRWASLLAELGSDFPKAPDHEIYRALLAQSGRLPAQRLDSLINELQRQMLRTYKESVA